MKVTFNILGPQKPNSPERHKETGFPERYKVTGFVEMSALTKIPFSLWTVPGPEIKFYPPKKVAVLLAMDPQIAISMEDAIWHAFLDHIFNTPIALLE